MFALILIFLFGTLLLTVPIVAGVLGIQLGSMATIILTGSGIVLCALSGIVMVITSMYQKTRASEAFVRTGMGGLKVIQDGGTLVLPVVHEIIRVPLGTIRLEVQRDGSNALITGDKLRADIKAEFFIRVQPEQKNIEAAARSLGDKLSNQEEIRKLIEDKLISALRTVAAKKKLEELNSDRDEFMKEVTGMVGTDLEHNGFMLETATISGLDQTPYDNLNDDNIFDAQGKRTIAEITQKQLTERNKLEKEGEQARTEQDVATRKKVLELEQERAEAEATQKAAVAKRQAEEDQKARQAAIDANRAIELAEVDKAKVLEVKEQERQQANEVAERDRAAAVAEAEEKMAQAEEKKAKAEAAAETERQNIVTVQVQAEAERDKKKRVIAAEAEAEEQYKRQARAADGEAYRLEKEADGKKAAADAEATAIIKKAEAERDAAKARADGKKAEEMVPVQVASEQVSVDKSRVNDVLIPELEAREKHGQAAQQFELDQQRIAAEKEVGIEAARALGQYLGSMTTTLFGTPEDAARMVSGISKGMGVTSFVRGVREGLDEETLAAAAMAGGKGLQVLGAIGKKMGIDVTELGLGTDVAQKIEAATEPTFGSSVPEPSDQPTSTKDE